MFEFLHTGGEVNLDVDQAACTDNFSSCSSATQAAPDETEPEPAPAPAPESGPVIVQAEVHRPQGKQDEG